MEQVFAYASEIPLTANMLKQLHRDLLQYSAKDERHRGEWKSLPNHVAAFDADGRELGIVFETSSPFDTPAHMDALLDWHRRAEADTGLHPLPRIGIFVVAFLAIHPFQDGDGRLSRILTTLLLLRAGYGRVPYSSLASIIEQNRRSLLPRPPPQADNVARKHRRLACMAHVLLRSIRQQITRLQQRLDASRPQLSPPRLFFETRETRHQRRSRHPHQCQPLHPQSEVRRTHRRWACGGPREGARGVSCEEAVGSRIWPQLWPEPH